MKAMLFAAFLWLGLSGGAHAAVSCDATRESGHACVTHAIRADAGGQDKDWLLFLAAAGLFGLMLERAKRLRG